MKSYLDLIPLSSKVHRKQTIMTRTCIVLAVFLITVIFGIADMHLQSQKTQQIQAVGNWHYRFTDIDDETATLISVRPEISLSGWHNTVDTNAGYSYAGQPIAISGQEQSVFQDIYLGTVAEGTYPNSDNEIAVSSKIREIENIKVGDSMEMISPSGETTSFIITGFIENTSRLVFGNERIAVLTPEGFHTLEALTGSAISNRQYAVRLSLLCDMEDVVSDIMTQFELSDAQLTRNVSLLGVLGQIDSSYASQIYMVVIVLFFVVLLTGILMISSSLNSNVMQRTEFFGMMRCLGATKKQVMRFVRREGLHWCKTAIPIGIIAGVVIVWILSAIMKAISPERFFHMPTFGISWVSILTGVLMGIITVLLAARSPAKKAAKVSPLEAVSGNSNAGNPVRKAAKTRLFKVETALGIHHAKAGKKNFILMTGSFAISIVLFLSFSTITDFMNHAMAPLKPWTPDLSIVSEENTCSIENAYIAQIVKNDAVKRVYGRMFAYDVPAVINGETKNSNLISYEKYQFAWAKDKLLEGSLENAMQENQALFVYNEKVPVHTGDVVSVSIDGIEREITVGGVLSDSPLARSADTETIICSENTFTGLTGQSDYTIIEVQFKNSVTDEDVSVIKSMFESGVSFADQRSSNQEAKNLYNSFAFFVYSFLFIIAVITVFNIINTISMSVSAKLKQYGAMRAIGMSNQQLVKMIAAEAATYAISGSIVGCILGLPLHMVIYLSLITTVWGDPWNIPFVALGMIITVVLISTFLAVLGPAKRIYNMSIIDTINAQ